MFFFQPQLIVCHLICPIGMSTYHLTVLLPTLSSQKRDLMNSISCSTYSQTYYILDMTWIFHVLALGSIVPSISDVCCLQTSLHMPLARPKHSKNAKCSRVPPLSALASLIPLFQSIFHLQISLYPFLSVL